LRLEYWSGTATLENTIIKDNGSKGIYASSGGTLSLDADSLINNGSYHAYLSSCALQATNCVFTDNDGMAEHGIRAYNVSGAVEDTSEFSDNYVHVYVQSNNGGMTLSDTNFDLGAYHIYNSSADTVEAEDNYWGTTNPATISGRMYGPVDWDPYRQGPVGKPILTSGREPLPASFDLMQNFPNPFNPVTVIRYQIPRFSVKDQAKQARVVLEIYNLLGQRVRRFVERTAMPGHYTVTWDSRDEEGRALASGIYFCRMQVGSFVKTNKMLLLR
jgi:flagellar hook assembly protein FlgD